MAKQPPLPPPVTLQSLLGPAAVQQEMMLFVAVSAMDVFMTYILLNQQGTQFVEANPVARFFIQEWGAQGMVYFKFAMVALVCVLSQIIARQKPRSARWLLSGATALVAVVVVYSLLLLLRHGDTNLELGFTPAEDSIRRSV